MPDGSVYPINPVIPDNVPPQRVYDYDVYQPAPPDGDFFAAIATVKATAPSLFWTQKNGGHWVVTDLAIARKVLGTSTIFSSSMLVVPRGNNLPGRGFVPINLDPPEHGKYRLHLSLALSRKSVHDLSGGIRDFCIELIEGLRPKGGCNFVTDFAFHLPILVFLRLVDLPEDDRLGLLEEVGIMMRPGGDKMGVVRRLMAYLDPILRARTAQPADDLISWLSTREVDGAPMSHQDLLSMCTLLLIGGLDSVANTLGFIAGFMAEHPAHRRQLIDRPELMSGAVDELLRRFPTVQAGVGRLVTQDTELDGMMLRAGDQVMLPTGLVNLGALEYPNPLEVDFERPTPMLGTFGHGAHKCPGATLARAEIAIFLEEWLKRIPDFSIKPLEPKTFSPGINISYKRLDLVWPTA